MKLISWNIDSLNAALTSDSARAQLSQAVLQTLVRLDADIIAIQETKLSANGPTKKHLKVLDELFPHSTMDAEGRIITLEFEKFFVTQVYTPNAGDGLKRLEERQIWDKKYADYLTALDIEKPVLATGDYNVAHNEIDLAHPSSNRRSPGFTDEERSGFTNLLNRGFTDTFRYIHGDIPNVYSWWAQRSKTSKINNSGWRIDYWLTSNRIADKVTKSEMIDSGTRQDHTPIVLEIEL